MFSFVQIIIILPLPKIVGSFPHKFESHRKNPEAKNCGKDCVSCSFLLKASLYQFKRVGKTFLMKNCESSNLIYVVICKE